MYFVCRLKLESAMPSLRHGRLSRENKGMEAERQGYRAMARQVSHLGQAAADV